MPRRVFVGDDPESGGIRLAAGVLTGGGIVAYPTDTLYGLGVDPRRPDAVARLCRLKGRAAAAGMPLIAAGLRQVESCLGDLPPLGRRLAAQLWPGPLTLVFDPTMPPVLGVHAADGSLAVRVPGCAVARRLADAGGQPVTATSANRGGAAPAATGAEVASALDAAVDLILEQSEPLVGAASTIVDVRGRRPTLIRAGAVPWDRVLQSLA